MSSIFHKPFQSSLHRRQADQKLEGLMSECGFNKELWKTDMNKLTNQVALQ